MENIGHHILKKCGWEENQLSFLGTLIYNIIDNTGCSIADIVCQRTTEIISVEWIISNKEDDKICLTYSLDENKIIKEKSDIEIYDEKSLNAFLDTIENIISMSKGNFYPNCKIVYKNTNKI